MSSHVQQRETALAAIFHTIDRARSTWRSVQVADGLVKVFLVVGGGLVGGFMADNLIHLPEPVRVGYVLLLLLALVGMVARFVVYPLMRRVTDEMVAAHIERAFPALDNRLINAVLFSNEKFRHPLTRQMALSQIEGTAQDVGVQDLARPVDLADLRRWAKWALRAASGRPSSTASSSPATWATHGSASCTPIPTSRRSRTRAWTCTRATPPCCRAPRWPWRRASAACCRRRRGSTWTPPAGTAPPTRWPSRGTRSPTSSPMCSGTSPTASRRGTRPRRATG